MNQLNDPFNLFGVVDPIEAAELLKQFDKIAPQPQTNNIETCPHCQIPMSPQTDCYICSNCRLISDVIISETLKERGSFEPLRFRIVGANSSYYQRDLDRAINIEYSEIQKKQIIRELSTYNQIYKEKNGKNLSKTILIETANEYNKIQKICVNKRNQTKQSILAAILLNVCFNNQLGKSEKEISEFMHLSKKGIAKGQDFLKSLHEDNKIELDFNAVGKIKAYTLTTLLELGLITESEFCEFDNIYPYLFVKGRKVIDFINLIDEIVQQAEKLKIGIKSEKRSKVIATIFIILSRLDTNIKLSEITDRCQIRKNTIQRFILVLEQYHSQFKNIFRKYGL
uniref:C315R homolog protein n=1 Tax=Abalone asfa-like virus TaxID=2839893 RepID=A0A5K7Y0U4_9VIRU|nr:C315R homolog protein [Abalone asfa-like virus]BCY04557.1 hypothetical protein [Abalone asfa-like virus]